MLRSSGKQKKFEYLDHPADIALRIYGESLTALFINAAEGLYDVLKPGDKLNDRKIKEKIEFFSGSIEGLLVSFLNELLFVAIKRHLIFSDFLINIKCSKDQDYLTGDMSGYIFGFIEREVKAVTYHKLKIERIDGLFQTCIVFDI